MWLSGIANIIHKGGPMKRSGSAVWQGDLKNGKGLVSTESGVLTSQQYSFGTRFENGKGTNPEELIAAAHAGCFSMALSAQLGNSGLTPEKLETKATVTLDKQDAGWAVTHILLDVKGRVPKADQAAWDKATQAAKAGCPISKLLNTTIEMQAKLEG
jgi:osmotically inducible protein OsmC